MNTICLPFDYFDGRTWAGKSLVVAGWGVTEQKRIGFEMGRLFSYTYYYKMNKLKFEKYSQIISVISLKFSSDSS